MAQTKSGVSMQAGLAWASTAVFVLGYAAPLIMSVIGHPVSGEAAQQLAQWNGAIILQWGGVMGYYFGTSKGSAAKDDTIAAMAARPSDPAPLITGQPR